MSKYRGFLQDHNNNNGGYYAINSKPTVKPTDLEKAGDDLVWAIESVIEDPKSIRRWFIVKDAIAQYKKIRYRR